MKRRADERRRSMIMAETAGGTIALTLSGKGIVAIELPRAEKRGSCGGQCGYRDNCRLSPVGKRTIALLRQYFSGRPVFFDLPLDLHQATDFQKAVWKATAKIPYGETRSYAWIAKRIGRPKAARAVGQALGANPVPVVIPCHRVISSAGTLGGFSGGLAMKRYLLDLEAGTSACAEARRKEQTKR